MRRYVICLLILCFLVATVGCAQTEELEKPVNFYYRNANTAYEAGDKSILPEVREGAGLDSLEAALQVYLQGPVSDDLYSPFPAGMQLQSVQMDGTSLTVTVSRELAQLSGIQLILACGCLAYTCMDMTEAESVTIRADGAMLDGKQEIILDRNTVLLLDDSSPKEE